MANPLLMVIPEEKMAMRPNCSVSLFFRSTSLRDEVVVEERSSSFSETAVEFLMVEFLSIVVSFERIPVSFGRIVVSFDMTTVEFSSATEEAEKRRRKQRIFWKTPGTRSRRKMGKEPRI